MTNTLFIGINGLAGAGKDTASIMLTYILENKDKSEEEVFDLYKYSNIRCVSSNLNQNLKYVQLHTFAEPLKALCSIMFGLPLDIFYNKKETGYVAISSNFEYTESITSDDIVVTADQFFNNEFKGENYTYKEVWMSIRELLVYVGSYIVNYYINPRTFINTINNKLKYTDYDYHIFTDLRMCDEVEYIKEHSGITIKIVRDNIKPLNNIAEHNLDDLDFDFVIKNNGNYKELFHNLYNLVHKNLIFINQNYYLDNFTISRTANLRFYDIDNENNLTTFILCFNNDHDNILGKSYFDTNDSDSELEINKLKIRKLIIKDSPTIEVNNDIIVKDSNNNEYKYTVLSIENVNNEHRIICKK